MKPSLNDFGIEGCIVPEYDAEQCNNCQACQIERRHPSKAIAFVNGRVPKHRLLGGQYTIRKKR